MPASPSNQFASLLREVSPEQHVLIAGPTASGKSALALEIAETQGGTIVNADASQVYDCWRILTARPSAEEEVRASHALYGHIAEREPYSAGHWLREVADLLASDARLIITGGTGLYFSALTEGLAEIPATPAEVRQRGDGMTREDMLQALDPETLGRIDKLNRARVQRAWEVQESTRRGLAAWQDDTGPPLLPDDRCYPVVFDVSKDWLEPRIATRFRLMIDAGVLEEVAAVRPRYDPALPAHRAIGTPELMEYLEGGATLDAACEAAVIATRQYAKRQRTWMRRRMKDWHPVRP